MKNQLKSRRTDVRAIVGREGSRREEEKPDPMAVGEGRIEKGTNEREREGRRGIERAREVGDTPWFSAVLRTSDRRADVPRIEGGAIVSSEPGYEVIVVSIADPCEPDPVVAAVAVSRGDGARVIRHGDDAA